MMPMLWSMCESCILRCAYPLSLAGLGVTHTKSRMTRLTSKSCHRLAQLP
jgi:hypothetical protein